MGLFGEENRVSCGVMTTHGTNMSVSQSKIRETKRWCHLPKAEKF